MPDFFKLHPYTTLVYFAGVVMYSMVFMHPVAVGVNVLLSTAASLALGKNEAGLSMKYTFFIGFVIALVNPFFNAGGETVLFTYFGRNYTVQALVYGMILGGIFISSINWFGCMGRVITSDKFMYIFGGKMPNLCMILTMVMGLIPFFQKKLAEIISAGNVLLKDESKTKQAFRALNVATGYAFEHAINLSVSMKNRGYGTGKTTKFTDYRIRGYDIAVLIATAVLNTITVVFLFESAVNVEIIPVMQFDIINVFGMTGFIILLAIPCIMYIFKELKWLYLKSKI